MPGSCHVDRIIEGTCVAVLSRYIAGNTRLEKYVVSFTFCSLNPSGPCFAPVSLMTSYLHYLPLQPMPTSHRGRFSILTVLSSPYPH